MKAVNALPVLSFAAVVMAGSVTIQNSCDYDIHVWSVGDEVTHWEPIKAGTVSKPEPFYSKQDGGGPSLKISRHSTLDNSTPLTQLEYTAKPDFLWYDLSNIDLGSTGEAPFVGKTLDLVPSKSGCRRVVCGAGDVVCKAAYNKPDDNLATNACDADASLFLDVCQSAKNANKDYNTLVHAKREATPEAEAAPATHVHKGLSHVHERIRRSRIFGRR